MSLLCANELDSATLGPEVVATPSKLAARNPELSAVTGHTSFNDSEAARGDCAKTAAIKPVKTTTGNWDMRDDVLREAPTVLPQVFLLANQEVLGVRGSKVAGASPLYVPHLADLEGSVGRPAIIFKPIDEPDRRPNVERKGPDAPPTPEHVSLANDNDFQANLRRRYVSPLPSIKMCQLFGHERPMTCLRLPLHAEKHNASALGELLDEPLSVKAL